MANLGSLMFQVGADTSQLKRAEADVTSSTRKMSAGFDQVQKSADSMSSTIQGAATSIGSMLGVTLGIVAVVDAFKELMQAGIQYNRTMETTKLGIASLLSASGDFTTASGRQLKGVDKLNAGLAESDKVLAKLKIDNLQTIATFEQLAKAFQQTLAPALSAGFNVDQVRQYTVAMMQAAGAMGLPLDMMAEETRSMLRGTITPRNTLIATALGITNEQIDRLKGDSQALFTFIMGKLEAFKTAGKASQDTFSGLFSNIKDVMGMAAGGGTAGLFENIKRAMQDFYNWAVKIDETTGKMTINPTLLGGFEKLAAVGNIILDAIIGTAKTIDSIANSMLWSVITKTLSTTDALLQKAIGSLQTPSANIWSENDKEFAELKARIEAMQKLKEEALAGLKSQDYSLSMNNLWDFSALGNLFDLGGATTTIATTTDAIEQLRDRMKEVGQDTSKIDAWLAGINNINSSTVNLGNASDHWGQVTDGWMKTAVEGLDNAVYAARAAALEFHNLANSATLAGMNMVTAAERALEIAKASPKMRPLIQAQQDIMAGTEKEWNRLYFSEKVQELPEGKRAGKVDELMGGFYEYAQKALALRAEKAGTGKGPKPLGFEDMLPKLEAFQIKVMEAYKTLEDANYDLWIAVAKASGDYYTAAQLETSKWAADQKSAIDKQVMEAQKAYDELAKSISGRKGGATPEALAALATAEKYLGEIREIAAKKYLTLQEQIDQKRKDELITLYDQTAKTADYVLQLAQLTGTTKDVINATLYKLEADRAVAVERDKANASIINQISLEKQRIEILKQSGSVMDGFNYAKSEYFRTQGTDAMKGIEIWGTFVKSIDSAADALAEFTMTGKMDFKSFADSIIRDIMRMVYKMALMSMFEGMFGKGGAGGSSMWGGIAQWFSGLFGGGEAAGAKAGGGPVYKSRPYLVGERGPEMFIPGRTGSIVSSNALNGGSAGPGVEVNIHNEGSTLETKEVKGPHFDGQKWVVDMWVKDAHERGPVFQVLQGMQNR